MWYSGEKQIVGHSKSKEGQVKQVQSEVKRKNGGKWEGRDKKWGERVRRMKKQRGEKFKEWGKFKGWENVQRAESAKRGQRKKKGKRTEKGNVQRGKIVQIRGNCTKRVTRKKRGKCTKCTKRGKCTKR